MTFRTLSAVCFVALSSVGFGQLTQFERKGLDDTLFLGNLAETDLSYARRPANAISHLPLIDLAIDQPIEAANALLALHGRADGTLADILATAAGEVFGDHREKVEAAATTDVEMDPGVPEALRQPLARLIAAVAEANAGVKAATAGLTPEEARSLLESLPQWANEQPSIKFDFVKTPQLPRAEILRLLGKVDMRKMRAAACMLADRIQLELPKLRELARTVTFDKLITFKSRSMVIELSGQENDVHDSRNTNLCLDLGGNDTYTGRYGAGPNYAGVLIDLGGNDTYDVPDLAVGAGVMGIGLAYDLGGTDSFVGKSLCFGAGLAGVGAFFKDGGNDTYEGRSLCQGFGEFGIGLLVDARGDDRYTAKFNAQGAARTQGVGWLVDQSGDDTYRAGRLIPDAMLGRDVTRSNAQGWSAGYVEMGAPLEGGVGLLSDLGGDDLYVGETHCQGAGAALGLGSLCDATGRDSYSATSNAQASADTGGCGFLFDLAGDDIYTVRGGCCHAFSSAGGTAFLLDRDGSDIYAAHDSRPAMAMTTGLSLFLDAAGDDRYFGPPAVGNPGRDSGSLAVFVDLSGGDVYADGLVDGQAFVRDRWGVAYDAESGAGEAASLAPRQHPKAGSIPLGTEKELNDALQAASNGDVRAADRLIGMGRPAFDWVMANHLPNASPGAITVIAEMVDAIGADARAAVVAKIASPNDGEARGAVLVAAELGAVEAAPQVMAVLKRPAVQAAAARLAGVLKTKEALNDLMAMTASDDKSTALAAMIALGKIGDQASVGTAQAFLGSMDLPLRKAALQVVASFPATAVAVGSAMAADPDVRRARIGIELLGVVGTDEALRQIGPYLSAGTAGQKIQAMISLDGRFPAEYRSKLAGLKTDVNPLVRAIASRVDPGR